MPDEQLRKAALEYHRLPVSGKIAVTPTKGLVDQRDPASAYTLGVAMVCEEIAARPAEASDYTARGNLVAVITNGIAVLGLGNIGPILLGAAKPADILKTSVTVRRIVNMTAQVVADAQRTRR